MFMKKALLGSVVLLGLAAGQANAATYNWVFDCASVSCSGSGSLETNVPAGPAAIVTSITGLWGGNAIIGLSALNGLGNNDNKLVSPVNPVLTNNGITFSTASIFVNLFRSGVTTGVAWLVNTNNFGLAGTSGEGISFSITPAPAVPIPAALPLFAAGLGAMGLMSRRKKRKADVAA